MTTSGGIFVSTERAAGIEQAEARLSESIGAASVARGSIDAFVDRIGGGVAVYAGASSPVNKMIGVGFGTHPSDDCLQAIEQKFKSRGAPLQAELSTLADPSVAARLTRRGYILQGFENVLGRPTEPCDYPENDRPRSIAIGSMRDEDLARWLDVAITGFQHADQQGVQGELLPPRDALEGALRDVSEAPGFQRYFAWVDGSVAGIASLRIDGAIAQLCGAATLLEFRRRGVQTALLRHRIATAFHSGCALAVMTTQPGSRSQENGHRQGFSLLYSRAVLVKDPF